MAVKSNMSELKRRAILAKQRMRMGYWQSVQDERVKKLEELGDSYDSVHLVRELQLAQVRREGSLALGTEQAIADELLYERVCRMLDENEDIINPLGKLVEREVYDRLDEGNRQKYILDLSKKFCEMKARYYRERVMYRARG